MAKSFKCADIGMKDCSFQATADTTEQLMSKVAAHAMSAHAMAQISPDIMAKVQGAIKTV